MDVLQQILKILKKIGIPLIVVVIIVGAFMVYRNWLEIKLLGLNIKQAKIDLGKEILNDKKII